MLSLDLTVRQLKERMKEMEAKTNSNIQVCLIEHIELVITEQIEDHTFSQIHW